MPTYGAPTSITVNGKRVWNDGRGLGYGAHLDGDSVVLTGLPEHAAILSSAAGSAPATLSATLTSSAALPVTPGGTISIPVTVHAEGDSVVRGSVSATVPAGWTSTSAPFSIDTRNGPGTAVVSVTATAPSSGSGGEISIPLLARAGTLQAGDTAHVLAFGAWPAGTTAVASSFHAPNSYNGATRTYDPANAIDGNLATFWNDDTAGAFPDTLTITAPAPVSLTGVTFGSIIDGVPTDFTVQSWDGTQWVEQASVTGNTDVSRRISFAQPVSTSRLRLVVTASQSQNGNFTRVAELTP